MHRNEGAHLQRQDPASGSQPAQGIETILSHINRLVLGVEGQRRERGLPRALPLTGVVLRARLSASIRCRERASSPLFIIFRAVVRLYTYYPSLSLRPIDDFATTVDAN